MCHEKGDLEREREMGEQGMVEVFRFYVCVYTRKLV